MLIGKPNKIKSSEITPESVYINRRKFIGKSVALGAGAIVGASAQAGLQPDDELTPERIVTSYNNFYEFGTDKSDPAKHAHTLTTDPWSVEVSGLPLRGPTLSLEAEPSSSPIEPMDHSL